MYVEVKNEKTATRTVPYIIIHQILVWFSGTMG